MDNTNFSLSLKIKSIAKANTILYNILNHAERMFEMINYIDFSILDFIQNNIRSPFLDTAMRTVTHLGDYGFIWIVVAILCMCIKKYRKDGFAITFALFLCLFLCNMVLKESVERLRPFQINTAFTLIIPPPAGYSFPSGHTCSSFAAAATLFMTASKKISIPALVLAVLISFSRLYLYVHFPTDVISGALLGLICAFLAVKLIDFICKNMNIRYSKFYSEEN